MAQIYVKFRSPKSQNRKYQILEDPIFHRTGSKHIQNVLPSVSKSTAIFDLIYQVERNGKCKEINYIVQLYRS